jgi:hypothetical protein
MNNTAPRQFVPPADDGGGDWILVIDDASRGYGPPGIAPLSLVPDPPGR